MDASAGLILLNAGRGGLPQVEADILAALTRAAS